MSVVKIVEKAIEEYNKNNFKLSLEIYKKTFKFPINNKDLSTIYYNMGLCHFSMFNYVAAEKLFQKSVDMGNLNSEYELSMSMLFNKKLIDGLDIYHSRYYGYRKNFPELPIRQVMSADECVGLNVLVLNEQGYGDEIMFSRGIDYLAEVSKSVNYQVYDKMIDLFQTNFKYENLSFFTERTLSYEFVNGFDCWLTSGDLFSSHVKKNNMYHKPFNCVKNDNLNNKIGVTWMANSESKSSKSRSIDINIIKDELLSSGCDIISLQYNECPDWMVNVDISNFKKTFDVIESLDMVVTVDTVTAHLAGMMGKKTILLYDKYLDWRWVYKFYENVEVCQLKLFKL